MIISIKYTIFQIQSGVAYVEYSLNTWEQRRKPSENFSSETQFCSSCYLTKVEKNGYGLYMPKAQKQQLKHIDLAITERKHHPHHHLYHHHYHHHQQHYLASTEEINL